MEKHLIFLVAMLVTFQNHICIIGIGVREGIWWWIKFNTPKIKYSFRWDEEKITDL
jgi:hypothetical protein